MKKTVRRVDEVCGGVVLSFCAATMRIDDGGADFSTAANCVGLSRLSLAYQPVTISDLLAEAMPLC